MREVRFGNVLRISEEPSIRDLRKVVLPILAVKKDGVVAPVGSCFIVSCTGREALALTAKHNIDYLIQIDGARPLHSPSTPREFQVVKFSSEPVNLKMYVAYFLKIDQVIPCYIVKAWFLDEGPDIAPILLRLGDGDKDVTFTHRLLIDSKGPRPGEHVHACGYIEMETSGHEIDNRGVVAKQTFSAPLKCVPCDVQECYSFREHHLVRWPCFKVNKSLDPGMSGGPAIYTRGDETIVCGVVSSSATDVEEGVCSKIYPATVIRVDAGFPFLSSKKPTLLECMKHGLIMDVSEAHKYVQPNGIWSDNELADFGLEFRDKKFLADGLMINLSESHTMNGKFVWLSDECLKMGQINKHNGDNSEYYLISKAVRATFNEFEKKGDIPTLEYVKAEKPYIWFKISDRTFRFFVFELSLPDDLTSIKIFTDAHIEEEQS